MVLQQSVLWWCLPVFWWESSPGVSSKSSSKQKDKGFWLVDLVVGPSSALLDTNSSPFHLRKQSTSWYLGVRFLGQDHMTILIILVSILIWILDLSWIVWHVIVCIFKILIWKMSVNFSYTIIIFYQNIINNNIF